MKADAETWERVPKFCKTCDLPFMVVAERTSRFCPYCGGVNIDVWREQPETGGGQA